MKINYQSFIREGKTGIEMVAKSYFNYDGNDMEAIVACHDFTAETITEEFKNQAKSKLEKMIKEYINAVAS